MPPRPPTSSAAAENQDDDRLFVREGFRHYRRRYSLTEVRWGWVVLATLLLIAGWVAWKGAHPDPSLFSDGAALLKPAEPVAVPVAASPAPSAAAPAAAAPTSVPAAPADRGPLPANLAGAGWTEDKVATFDEENLYVKIDGRADYFRAFGFTRLYSVLLIRDGDPATTIDVEMYDLRRPPNALGAYGGERPQNAKVEVTAGGLHHFDRNALFMARGRYYIRVLGSDETPLITAKLHALADQLIAQVATAPLPWAYGVVLGQMGLGADRMTYFAKNAFSLGFADDVWSVRPLGKDHDLELFLSARKDVADARALVGKLQKSFAELGSSAGKRKGVTLVKDQFLGLFSAATNQDRFVLGVRGAESGDVAIAQLDKLKAALLAAPEEVRARAAPIATEPEAEGAPPAGKAEP
jgi:hypothetical protein